MGFSVSWLAVKSDDLDKLFKIADISSTTKTDDLLVLGFSDKDGWCFLEADKSNHPISKNSLSRISVLGETIACSVNECVMVSVVECWNNGKQTWSIAHDAQEGMFDLTVKGGFLPDQYENIKNFWVSQQNAEGGDDADVDFIFEIPVQVAKHICGYKHDEDFVSSSLVYYLL